MTPAQRLPDWRNRLAAVIERYKIEPFEWGRTDCAHFAADCIEATTGADTLGTFRAAYTSRLTAASRLRGHRCRTVAEAASAAAEAIGAVPIPPRFARIGDVGVTSDDILAVRTSKGFVARSETDGRFYRVNCVKAWAVG